MLLICLGIIAKQNNIFFCTKMPKTQREVHWKTQLNL
jgi:hypothetical protein